MIDLRRRLPRMKVLTITDDGKPRRLTAAEKKRWQRATGSSKAYEPDESQASAGMNELAVIEECRQYPLTAERPGIYQQALSMARMLDNPDLQGIWPRCSRDLCKLLEDLRPKTSKRKTQRSNVVRLRA